MGGAPSLESSGVGGEMRGSKQLRLTEHLLHAKGNFMLAISFNPQVSPKRYHSPSCREEGQRHMNMKYFSSSFLQLRCGISGIQNQFF